MLVSEAAGFVLHQPSLIPCCCWALAEGLHGTDAQQGAAAEAASALVLWEEAPGGVLPAPGAGSGAGRLAHGAPPASSAQQLRGASGEEIKWIQLARIDLNGSLLIYTSWGADPGHAWASVTQRLSSETQGTAWMAGSV